MSCYESCYSGRQPACCDQAPSIGGHIGSIQPNKVQIAGSFCHACSPHLPTTNCCSCGCPCHPSLSPAAAQPHDPHVCPTCSSTQQTHTPHHYAHHHQPAVASPLLYSHHHHHHLIQTTPTNHNSANTSKLHPSLEPSPLCQSTSHRPQGGSALCLSKTHRQREGSPLCRSTSHPGLELSPLCRPHSRMQLHPSSSYSRPQLPHREKLFISPESTHSGSKLFPPSLDFSPVDSECNPLPSKVFQLGMAAGSSPGNASSPKKIFSPNKLTNPVAQVPVVVSNEETDAKYVQEGEAVPTNSTPVHTGPGVSDHQVKIQEIQSTLTPPTSIPPIKAVSSTRSKGRSPILLYDWCFKLMANGMVILLGYKSQDSDELKWRSGPISERLSSTLLMTKSGQLYHLMGLLSLNEMNKESQQVDQQTLKKFKRGFPSEWEELLCKPKSSSVDESKEKSFQQPATPELVAERKAKLGKQVAGPAKRRVKKEVPDDPLQVMTPVMTESAISTPMSSFVNSLKRSSRGRTLKPARSTVSPCLATCDDLYTYDWCGNFQGVTSTVIDLTVCDDPLPTKKKAIKKEPVEQKPKLKPKPKHASKSVVPPTTNVPPTDVASPTTVAPPTVPKKQKSQKTGKVVVGNTHSPEQAKRKRNEKIILENEVSALDPDHNSLEAGPSRHRHKSADSDVEGVSRTEQHKGKKVRKSTKTSSKSATTDRNRDAESRKQNRQPATGGRGKEMNINRERAMSDVNGGHEDDQLATVAKPHSSSAGGKRRGVKRTTEDVRMALPYEEDSDGHPRHQQRDGYPNHIRDRRMYNMETETDSDESEMKDVNQRGQPISPWQQAPAKNGSRKEHKLTKTHLVRLSDSMKGSSPLKITLSPSKKRSSGAVGNKVPMSSAGTVDELRDDKMTEAELRNLRQVVHGVPALTTNFWEVVAQQMKTGHTAHQCCNTYHELRGKMKPPSQRPRKKEKPKPVAKAKVTKVTGGTGTLKRKRELRDALEEMDKGYHDDIFDSTPFKKMKKSVMIPESDDYNFEGEENSFLEEEETNAPQFSLCTPSTARNRVGAPYSKTPNLCDYLTTPDLKSGLKRDVADHVIYKAQKAQRGGKKTVSFQKPLTSSKPVTTTTSSSSNNPVTTSRGSKPFVFEQKLHNIRTGELTTLRMFEDSDDSSSEDADPFDDILTTL